MNFAHFLEVKFNDLLKFFCYIFFVVLRERCTSLFSLNSCVILLAWFTVRILLPSNFWLNDFFIERAALARLFLPARVLRGTLVSAL